MTLAALALVVLAVSQLAPTGGAAQDVSINRRVAALEKKVKVLQSSSTALKKRVATVEGLAACFATSAPIPSARSGGYLFTPDHGTTVGETTALDATNTGQTPQAYIVTLNPSCLGSSAGLKHPSSHRGWASPHALPPRSPAEH
jgi:hypothetical protein